MERKLAAIFSTDAKGYSRLMGDDEEATIHTLKTYRAVTTALIEQHPHQSACFSGTLATDNTLQGPGGDRQSS